MAASAGADVGMELDKAFGMTPKRPAEHAVAGRERTQSTNPFDTFQIEQLHAIKARTREERRRCQSKWLSSSRRIRVKENDNETNDGKEEMNENLSRSRWASAEQTGCL